MQKFISYSFEQFYKTLLFSSNWLTKLRRTVGFESFGVTKETRSCYHSNQHVLLEFNDLDNDTLLGFAIVAMATNDYLDTQNKLGAKLFCLNAINF